jgi:ABC-type transport system substrate-binding protein
MVSPTAFQKNGIDWMRWNMVGAGPFIQTGFQRDAFLTASRNPSYWDTGKPYVDGAKIIYVVDPVTSEALMKSGGGDILDCGGNGQVASDLQKAGYQIITQMGGAGVLVPDSMNADSPWSNVNVRLAGEYAIDKESIAKNMGYGFLQAAYQVDRPNQIDYDTNLTPRKYDVAKAKQLLTDAGYPNGFKTTLIIPPTGITRDQAQAVQANLAAVGIQAQLQFLEASAAQVVASGTWHNALLFNVLRNFPNPNSGFMFAFGVPQSTMYQSLKKPDGWAALLTASVTATTPDPVTAQKCEDALYNDATVIPMYYTMGEFAVTNQIHDIGFGSWGTISYWNPGDAWFSK